MKVLRKGHSHQGRPIQNMTEDTQEKLNHKAQPA